MSSPDLASLAEAYERSCRYVESLRSRARQGDVSVFWAQHFADRTNFPAFNDVLVLRRGGFTYGVGEVAAAPDETAELDWARATWHVVRASAPDLDLSEWPEPAIGAPFTFEIGGERRSGSAIINALTSHRIVRWCLRLGLERPLRVLEIGPGYGQGVVQLLNRLPIERYAICDLPENLFLSSYYLQVAQSRLRVSFVGREPAPKTGIVFATPPDLRRLSGPFDLVVNAYSLQEMNLESVREYFEFVAEQLSEDGFFYSLNSHGKAGVRTPSDYPVDLFDVVGFGPLRRYPFHLFATEPYELVLTRGTGRELSTAELDHLGVLLQLGFVDELAPLCDLLVTGGLDAQARQWLARVRCAISGGASGDERRRIIARVTTGDACPGATKLISGVLEYALGDANAAARALREALPLLGADGARVRALLVLGAATRDAVPIDEAEQLAPHLRGELRRLARDRSALRARLCELFELPLSAHAAVRSRVGRLFSAARGR